MVVQFNESVKGSAEFTGDSERLDQFVEAVQAWGGTALYDAVHYALARIRDRPGRKAVVVFSDGDDNRSGLKEQEVLVPGLPPLEVYVAYPTPEAREVALGLVRDLRQAGVGAVMAMGGRSLKSQMRQADALDARYVAILGAEELATGTVLLRRMADGGQQRVLLRDLPYLFQPAPEEGPPEQG